MKVITMFQLIVVCLYIIDTVCGFFGSDVMGLQSILVLAFAITYCINEDRKASHEV
jgi:hypothetical protein